LYFLPKYHSNQVYEFYEYGLSIKLSELFFPQNFMTLTATVGGNLNLSKNLLLENIEGDVQVKEKK